MNRTTLLKALNLAKPSLGAPGGVLPIMSHFCFMGDCLYAYNDILATIVEEPTGLTCGLHGDTLIGLLEAATVDDLKVKLNKEGVAQMDVGSGWVKVPTLPEKDFLFSLPDVVPVLKLRITDEVRRALELCLMSVGTDSLKPEFTGVTVIFAKGQAIFFSSNNETAARYVAADKVMGRKEISFVLPADACEQVLRLQGSVGEGQMLVADNVVCITYGKENKTEATLISKLLEAKVDFHSMFGRHLQGTGGAIPPQLASELKKAAVLLGRESTKRCMLNFTQGKIIVQAAGMLGSMETEVPYPGKGPQGVVHVDPEVVLRILPRTDTVAVNDLESLVFSGGGYTIIVASEAHAASAS